MRVLAILMLFAPATVAAAFTHAGSTLVFDLSARWGSSASVALLIATVLVFVGLAIGRPVGLAGGRLPVAGVWNAGCGVLLLLASERGRDGANPSGIAV